MKLEMSFEIHALMQNANHDNATLTLPKEQHVAACRISQVAWSDTVA
jgi:hypothetical protein